VLAINPKQKAIIVSGFSETERVKKALVLGAGAYVRKPYVLERIGLSIKDELTKAEAPDSWSRTSDEHDNYVYEK
ncbi:MAG: response regulator transcription factor, partial [Syntrophales bacterium]